MLFVTLSVSTDAKVVWKWLLDLGVTWYVAAYFLLNCCTFKSGLGDSVSPEFDALQAADDLGRAVWLSRRHTDYWGKERSSSGLKLQLELCWWTLIKTLP